MFLGSSSISSSPFFCWATSRDRHTHLSTSSHFSLSIALLLSDSSVCANRYKHSSPSRPERRDNAHVALTGLLTFAMALPTTNNNIIMNEELPIRVNQSCTLLARMPFETLREVLSYLDDFTDRQILRATCYFFRLLIKAPTHSELLIFELTKYGRDHKLFTCRYCLRIRPGNKFSDQCRRGKKGKFGSHPEQRYCIECGLKEQPRYQADGSIAPSGTVRHYSHAHTFSCDGVMCFVTDREDRAGDVDSCVLICSQVHCGKYVELQQTGGSSETEGEQAF